MAIFCEKYKRCTNIISKAKKESSTSIDEDFFISHYDVDNNNGLNTMDKRILVVDDSKTMRDMLSFMLQSIGFNVVEAEDGLDGLSKAKIHKFDLVITDINMPNMDGYELIKCLRVEEQYKFTPILVVSTEDSTTMKRQGKDAGATGWIVKPFIPDKLEAIVKRLL